MMSEEFELDWMGCWEGVGLASCWKAFCCCAIANIFCRIPPHTCPVSRHTQIGPIIPPKSTAGGEGRRGEGRVQLCAKGGINGFYWFNLVDICKENKTTAMMLL
jgi:hypothetical protein